MAPYEANGLARILLTIVTIGFSFVPIGADFNRTHATNPLWTPHARFHVVWQCLTALGIGIIGLMLLWNDYGQYHEQLMLVIGFAASAYGAFFITFFAMPLYGGRAYDDNGYLPIKIGPLSIDLNVTVFGTFVILLIIAATSIKTA
jgi:hypothetical protein